MEREIIHYPQDEMTSLLLPVSQGCSYNGCAFCGMYKDQGFKGLAKNRIEQILRGADPYTERIFLTGGDPLALGYARLASLLELVRKYLPYKARIASYASVSNIKALSDQQLASLHNLGLNMLYIGFESGSDRVLRRMNKSHSRSEAIEEARRLNKAHIRFNSIILLGIAGSGGGEENALATSSLLNHFDSASIITMRLRIFQGTPLQKMVDRGSFIPARDRQVLEEMLILIEGLKPRKALDFDSSHPTNLLKFKAVLPWEREALKRRIEGRLEEIPL